MKKVFFYCLFIYVFNSYSQIGKIDDSFFESIEKNGLTYYKNNKNKRTKKTLPGKYLPKDKSIVYNGKNLQLILMGLTTFTDLSSGIQKTDVFSMLYVKKTNEDHFTYIGYYPDKRDQISVVPFKKHAPRYLKDYPELAEKVAKKKKGYKRFNAIAVFKEYDAWLSSKK